MQIKIINIHWLKKEIKSKRNLSQRLDFSPRWRTNFEITKAISNNEITIRNSNRKGSTSGKPSKQATCSDPRNGLKQPFLFRSNCQIICRASEFELSDYLPSLLGKLSDYLPTTRFHALKCYRITALTDHRVKVLK